MQAPKSTSRPPNLLGKATPDPADYCPILASMEHGFVHTAAASARDHSRGGALTLAAVTLLGLLGWLAYEHAGMPPSADAPRVVAAPAQLLPEQAPQMPTMAATINDIVAPAPIPLAPPALAADAKAAAPAYARKLPRPAGAQESDKSDRDVTLLAALLAHDKGRDD